MTVWEDFRQQLNAIDAKCIMYYLEILDGSFMPYKTLVFDNREEMEKAYQKLEPVHFPAYLKKYAKVMF